MFPSITTEMRAEHNRTRGGRKQVEYMKKREKKQRRRGGNNHRRKINKEKICGEKTNRQERI